MQFWRSGIPVADGDGADRWDGLAQYGLQFLHAFNSKMLSNATSSYPAYAGDGVLDWFTVGKRWNFLDQTIDVRNPPGSLLQKYVDYNLGILDNVTAGLTANLRQYLKENIGLPDPVNYNSDAYRIGGQVGQLISAGMMVFGVGAPGLLTTAFYATQAAGGVLNGVYAYADGDILGAATAFAGAALAVMGPFVSPCSRASTLVAWSQRALHGVAAGQGVVAAFQSYSHGDYFGCFVNLVDAGANLYMGARPCFAGNMCVLTRRGWIRWDQLGVLDEVASCDEKDPKGKIEFKHVAAIVRNLGKIWHVQVKGKNIRTSAEHPFFVWGKGWLPAYRLQPGDRMRSDDGQMVAVEKVYETDAAEMVYNCVVEDYHTYFVSGGKDWGFSVWAHNRSCTPSEQLDQDPNQARRSLRRSMRGIQSDQEAHHVIPFDKRDHPLVEAAAAKGWEMNRGSTNGAALETPSQHNGSHPNYSDNVNNKLDSIVRRNGGVNDRAVAEFGQYVGAMQTALTRLQGRLR